MILSTQDFPERRALSREEALKDLKVALRYKQMSEKLLIYDNYVRRSYFKLSVSFLRQKFLSIFKLWKAKKEAE